MYSKKEKLKALGGLAGVIGALVGVAIAFWIWWIVASYVVDDCLHVNNIANIPLKLVVLLLLLGVLRQLFKPFKRR